MARRDQPCEGARQKALPRRTDRLLPRPCVSLSAAVRPDRLRAGALLEGLRLQDSGALDDHRDRHVQLRIADIRVVYAAGPVAPVSAADRAARGRADRW